MASLEYINYSPKRFVVDKDGAVHRVPDIALQAVTGLPQLFWKDGTAWRAANLWAFQRANDGITDIKTIRSNLSHLHKFGSWLEAEELDWQHFPMVERERVLIRWRKFLVEQRDKFGVLAPSTTTQRMNATISFYRFAKAFGLIGRGNILWEERQVVRKYFDSVGFARTMLRQGANLAIPCRVRHGLRLEEGLTPLSDRHRQELLDFTSLPSNVSRELNLMLKLGFFTGARLETITSLKRDTLKNAISDPEVPGLFYLAVGPGNHPHVSTKFNVSGQIIVTAELLNELREYCCDIVRLKREAAAAAVDKDLIFLTRYGRSYVDSDSRSGSAVGRAMVDLRRRATKAGLAFAKNFYFHQTRATFGTSLTSLLLSKAGANERDVLAIVSSLMLHKDVSTTLKYIKFVQEAPMRLAVANEYSEAFLGIGSRIGDNSA